MWKQYTSSHQSTKEQIEYIEQIKQSMAANDKAPEFYKNFLFAYYEESKEGDINEMVQKNELIEYNVQHKQKAILESNFSEVDVNTYSNNDNLKVESYVRG